MIAALLAFNPVSNVDTGSHVSIKFPIRSEPGHAMVHHPAKGAIKSFQAIFHQKWYPLVEGGVVDFHATVGVFGMDAIEPAVAHFLLKAPSGEFQPSAVKIIAQFICSRLPDENRGGICQNTKAGFAFEHFLLRQFLLCNIMDEISDIFDFAGFLKRLEFNKTYLGVPDLERMVSSKFLIRYIPLTEAVERIHPSDCTENRGTGGK